MLSRVYRVYFLNCKNLKKKKKTSGKLHYACDKMCQVFLVCRGVTVNDNQGGKRRILTLYCCFYDEIATSPLVCIACSLAWSLLHRSKDRKITES